MLRLQFALDIVARQNRTGGRSTLQLQLKHLFSLQDVFKEKDCELEMWLSISSWSSQPVVHSIAFDRETVLPVPNEMAGYTHMQSRNHLCMDMHICSMDNL